LRPAGLQPVEQVRYCPKAGLTRERTPPPSPSQKPQRRTGAASSLLDQAGLLGGQVGGQYPQDLLEQQSEQLDRWQ